MKPILIRSGLIGVLLCLVILNFYKTQKLYSHPDFPYDARNIHLSGKLWLQGKNPYNDSLLKAEWNSIAIKNQLETTKPPGFPDCGMIYPFFSIPILIPYYILDWSISRVVIQILSWLFIVTIAYFGHKVLSFGKLGFGLFLLVLLAFKSSLVAVALGQPLLMSLAALITSWYFYLKEKDSLSGFLLGLALVKITLCLPFLILFLANKKWKLLFYSTIIPMLGVLSFYAMSGSLFIPEMLANMSHQMQINYAGNTLTAVNTNLTELGILFNYFLGVDLKFISLFNLSIMFLGFGMFVLLYLKKQILQYQFLALLISWNFMFSYHLIYDCILLIFLIPIIDFSVLKKWIWLLLLSPLFLPINGIFKNIDWIQFHLPITLLGLFLYLSYDCYHSYRKRIV